MATVAATEHLGARAAASTAYERFAGVCAIVGGAVTFLYAVSFVILKSESLSSLCLLVSGALTTRRHQPADRHCSHPGGFPGQPDLVHLARPDLLAGKPVGSRR